MEVSNYIKMRDQMQERFLTVSYTHLDPCDRRIYSVFL